MGRLPTKAGENRYFIARKEASKYNERLSSREGAAEMLNVSPSTVAAYELGLTSVPVDMVVMMADLYNEPSLKNQYCCYDCPIGRGAPMATEIDDIRGITLRFLDIAKDGDIGKAKDELVSIAKDGKITADELPKLKEVMDLMDAMTQLFSEARMYYEKLVDGGAGHDQG